jgi:hypothetical protein
MSSHPLSPSQEGPPQKKRVTEDMAPVALDAPKAVESVDSQSTPQAKLAKRYGSRIIVRTFSTAMTYRCLALKARDLY